MGEITLSAAVRSNLSSLQATSEMLGKVQNRLSTGQKVNSALDNPSSFFTASSLNSRAGDLGGLMDDIGQSVQTLKAADEGIKGITKLVESAKAKANQAQGTTNQAERKQYAQEYNELLSQVEGLAKDAGYNGKNLLGGTGNDVTVTFNEDGSSKLDVTAVNYTDSSNADGLNLSDLGTGSAATGTISFTNGSSTAAGLTSGAAIVTDNDFSVGDVLTFTDGGGTELGTIEVTASTTVSDVESKLDSFKGVSASFSGGDLTITSDVDLNVKETSATSTTVVAIDATDSDFASDASIKDSLAGLNNALSSLRSQSSTFGTNLSVVENRQDFTKGLVNTLEEGAGKLTLADTNKEGANLLALQTRQALSSTALSLSAQADQNVLRLF